MISEIEKYAIQKVVMDVTASIGLVCSLTCIILLTTIYLKFPKYINRMPIRLIFFISLSDTINHFSGIFYLDLMVNPNKSLAIAILQQFSKHLYIFTNISVCYLLQRVIIFGKRANFRHEIILITLSLVFSGASVLILYLFNMIGVVIGDKYHLIAPNANLTQFYLWIVDGIIQAFCIFYCLITVIAIHIKLYVRMNGIFAHFNQDTLHDIQLYQRIKNIVSTTILFPIAPIIILPMGFIQLILTNYLNIQVDRTYDIVRSAIMGLCGVFTLVALLLDFNFRKGLKLLFLTLLNRQEEFDGSSVSIDPNWNFNANPIDYSHSFSVDGNFNETAVSKDTNDSTIPMNQV